MSNCQLRLIERLPRFGNELKQSQSSTHVLRRSANSGSDDFDGVGIGLDFNQGSISLRFIERMHAYTLDVLDDL